MSFNQAMTILSVSEGEDVGIMDPDNPKSMFSLLPDPVQSYALAIPRKYFVMSERKLKARAEPDFTLKCLRMNMWQSYCKHQPLGKTMSLGSIVHGVTTREYFLHIAREEPAKLAFVMIPPKSYDVMQRQIFEDSLEKLKDILEMDLVDIQKVKKPNKDGLIEEKEYRKINTAAIAEVRKVAEMLSDRIQGSVTQKIQMQGQVAHAHAQLPPQEANPTALGSIDAMLKLIESKLGDVVDVDAE